MSNRMQGVGVAAGLLLGWGAAVAAEPGSYGFQIAADAGPTFFHVRKARLDQFSGAPAATSTLDNRDAGLSLSVGYRFSPYLAFEAAYLDLGGIRYMFEGSSGTFPLELASQGPAFSALGTLPLIRPLLLEGRVGIYLGESKLRADLPSGSFPIPLDPEDLLGADGGADAALLLGVGLVARLGRHWSVRLGYDYVSDQATVASRPPISGEPSFPGASINAGAGRLSLGFRIQF